MKIVKLLIDYEAEINLQDKYGNTALMKATESGSIEVVDMLIQAWADISAVKRFIRIYEFRPLFSAKKNRMV